MKRVEKSNDEENQKVATVRSEKLVGALETMIQFAGLEPKLDTL